MVTNGVTKPKVSSRLCLINEKSELLLQQASRLLRGAAARGEANICLCVDTEELKTVFDSLFKLLVFPFIGKFHLQSCFFDNDIFLKHLKSVPMYLL